jgi:hypothetical protein
MAVNYPLVIGGVAAATLFGTFAPAAMNELPTCGARDVTRMIVKNAREQLAGTNLPAGTINVAGIEDIPNESYTYTCKAALHVDGGFAPRITYEVSWAMRLIGGLQVDIRAAN